MNLRAFLNFFFRFHFPPFRFSGGISWISRATRVCHGVVNRDVVLGHHWEGYLHELSKNQRDPSTPVSRLLLVRCPLICESVWPSVSQFRKRTRERHWLQYTIKAVRYLLWQHFQSWNNTMKPPPVTMWTTAWFNLAVPRGSLLWLDQVHSFIPVIRMTKQR